MPNKDRIEQELNGWLSLQEKLQKHEEADGYTQDDLDTVEAQIARLRNKLQLAHGQGMPPTAASRVAELEAELERERRRSEGLERQLEQLKADGDAAAPAENTDAADADDRAEADTGSGSSGAQPGGKQSGGKSGGSGRRGGKQSSGGQPSVGRE